MAADRSITCTNKEGNSVTFRESGFFPFLLVSAEGVYDNKSDVFMKENSSTDGATFQGGKVPCRNIVLTVRDIAKERPSYGETTTYITSAIIRGKTLEILEAYNSPDYNTSNDFIDHRRLLDTVFKHNELGTLTFREGLKEKEIDYIVESVTSDGTHSSRFHTISLLCPDPFFYNPDEEKVVMGELTPKFKFFHKFTADGEEFGSFITTYSSIFNDSESESTGMVITLVGKADIQNPGFSRLESGEFIKLGTTENPYTLAAGNLLTITTGFGNKHVYLTSGSTTTEVNYLLAEGSTFIQLMRGENNIYFNCDSGRTTARVEITYRQKYARA